MNRRNGEHEGPKPNHSEKTEPAYTVDFQLMDAYDRKSAVQVSRSSRRHAIMITCPPIQPSSKTSGGYFKTNLEQACKLYSQITIILMDGNYPINMYLIRDFFGVGAAAKHKLPEKVIRILNPSEESDRSDVSDLSALSPELDFSKAFGIINESCSPDSPCYKAAVAYGDAWVDLNYPIISEITKNYADVSIHFIRSTELLSMEVSQLQQLWFSDLQTTLSEYNKIALRRAFIDTKVPYFEDLGKVARERRQPDFSHLLKHATAAYNIRKWQTLGALMAHLAAAPSPAASASSSTSSASELKRFDILYPTIPDIVFNYLATNSLFQRAKWDIGWIKTHLQKINTSPTTSPKGPAVTGALNGLPAPAALSSPKNIPNGRSHSSDSDEDSEGKEARTPPGLLTLRAAETRAIDKAAGNISLLGQLINEMNGDEILFMQRALGDPRLLDRDHPEDNGALAAAVQLLRRIIQSRDEDQVSKDMDIEIIKGYLAARSSTIVVTVYKRGSPPGRDRSSAVSADSGAAPSPIVTGTVVATAATNTSVNALAALSAEPTDTQPDTQRANTPPIKTSALAAAVVPAGKQPIPDKKRPYASCEQPQNPDLHQSSGPFPLTSALRSSGGKNLSGTASAITAAAQLPGVGGALIRTDSLVAQNINPNPVQSTVVI